MDTDIIKEALTVYVQRMGDDVKELRRAVVRGELDGRSAAELIKTFEEQKSRAMKTRGELVNQEG